MTCYDCRRICPKANLRFTEDMVFPLDIVDPATKAKEGLVCSQELLRFRDVDKTNSLKQFNAIRFAFEISEIGLVKF